MGFDELGFGKRGEPSGAKDKEEEEATEELQSDKEEEVVPMATRASPKQLAGKKNKVKSETLRK